MRLHKFAPTVTYRSLKQYTALPNRVEFQMLFQKFESTGKSQSSKY